MTRRTNKPLGAAFRRRMRERNIARMFTRILATPKRKWFVLA